MQRPEGLAVALIQSCELLSDQGLEALRDRAGALEALQLVSVRPVLGEKHREEVRLPEEPLAAGTAVERITVIRIITGTCLAIVVTIATISIVIASTISKASVLKV